MRSDPHINFSRYPLALLGAGFTLGILSAWLLLISEAHRRFFLLLFVAAGLLASVALLVLLAKRRILLGNVCVALAVLSCGATLFLLEKQPASEHSIKRLLDTGVIKAEDPVELTGAIVGAPQFAPDGLYLDFRVERLRHQGLDRAAVGRVSLALKSNAATVAEYELLELRYGARLRVMTKLSRADRYRNPGVSSFTEFLDRKGIDAGALIKSPLLIERLADERVFLPLAWLYSRRRDLEQRINASFPPQTAGVLNAALIGNRYGLSRATAERFREGGTFHVLVISGLHISFIGGVVLLIARKLTRNRLSQSLWAGLLLWSYTFAVGAEVSVTRAAFMFSFVALGPLVARRSASLNALGAAALLLLVYRPSDLFDPSFQLTFLSVFAIVALAWPLLEGLSAIGSWRPANATPCPPAAPQWLREFSELLFWSERGWREELAQSNQKYRLFKLPLAVTAERYHLQRLLRYSFSAIVISLSVQIVLLPLQIVYFHRLSFASIVLNIGVSVLMAVLSLVALVGVVIMAVSTTLAGPFIAAANGINWLMVHSVDLFSWFGRSSIRLPEYAGWQFAVYILYYVPLILLIVRLARWRPVGVTRGSTSPPSRHLRWFLLLTQFALVCVLVSHPFSAADSEGKLRVDFIDVGQGDATLFTMPNGATLLVDGGGRPEIWRQNNDPDEEAFEPDVRPIGESVVSEFLWARGLAQVDYVLATHADADHIDGLNNVVANFKVRGALLARTPTADSEYQKFAGTMSRNRVPATLIGTGDTLQFGDATATVLWPPADGSLAEQSRNNDSIVLLVHFGKHRMVLTGDIEKSGEAALVRDPEKLRSDLVKVAHHGSKTSSTEQFVKATQARFAIIPVGRTSIFGHPHAQVVERWIASGAKVMTTGDYGTITVTSDGNELQIEAFVRVKTGQDLQDLQD